jgi:hypothetical protein
MNKRPGAPKLGIDTGKDLARRTDASEAFDRFFQEFGTNPNNRPRPEVKSLKQLAYENLPRPVESEPNAWNIREKEMRHLMRPKVYDHHGYQGWHEDNRVRDAAELTQMEAKYGPEYIHDIMDLEADLGGKDRMPMEYDEYYSYRDRDTDRYYTGVNTYKPMRLLYYDRFPNSIHRSWNPRNVQWRGYRERQPSFSVSESTVSSPTSPRSA